MVLYGTADGLTSNGRQVLHDPDGRTYRDYFAAAVCGATTVIIPEAYTRVPASLSQLMATERLTTFYAVPLAMIQLTLHGALEKRDLSALRWVLSL